MAKEHTKIEDYAFLSDTQTGALVSRDGCVDWLCFPRFDSPACFASLVGDKENGHWRFFLEENVEATRRRYRGETLILETEIETKSGAVRLIDFMPPRGENPDIVRIIEGVRGKVSMQMELIVRFDYGQIVPWVRRRKQHEGLEAIAGPDGLILRTPVETCGKDLTTVAEFSVAKGDRIPFVLTWFESHKDPPRKIHADHALRREHACGLLERLAHRAFLGRFARVQVTGRRVQAQSLGGVLLDQQVAACILDDGRDGDVGFPASAHLTILKVNGRRLATWFV